MKATQDKAAADAMQRREKAVADKAVADKAVADKAIADKIAADKETSSKEVSQKEVSQKATANEAETSSKKVSQKETSQKETAMTDAEKKVAKKIAAKKENSSKEEARKKLQSYGMYYYGMENDLLACPSGGAGPLHISHMLYTTFCVSRWSHMACADDNVTLNALFLFQRTPHKRTHVTIIEGIFSPAPPATHPTLRVSYSRD